MRVAVECKSPLLQKSLEIFLSKHLSSLKNCDIVVRDIKVLDDERTFYISSSNGSDLIKPFSKSQLILALERRYKEMNRGNLHYLNKIYQEDELDDDSVMGFDILQKRIESLTKEYQENILRAVRAFYEK
ncbi:conserved hypothetical protein [Sulfurimonas denitrificans DSM 1251]|uniref:JHP0747 family n=1 Tax=Sulfurimonas denitrificans (strain ATCC 33889 / DSM 1251) TaxID=326298 RepID=Q30T42_SULDN|nr:hypothetical protein [Sulfurimonas denitrificans]ABB43839.1 conserved hypothetical protein [Sulfurimonas denitrificans DSM 1251]MDD3443071.1 hypothetical protein [Sulfurimonas denitrificans]